MLPDISAAEITKRIAEARSRINASAPASAETSVDSQLYRPTVKRRYDESYSRGDVDWLPRRAEIEIGPPLDVYDSTGPSEFRELTVTLSSGPEAIYRYFPFAAYIYVGHELSAIAQFNGEWQTQELRVVVPANRKCILTVITEISDFRPLLGLTEDERQVALILCGLNLGGPANPRRRSSDSLAPVDDYVSQSRTPLTRGTVAPVFVIGAYRSATSILTWAIGQHPNLWPLEETGWLHLFGLGALASHRLASDAKRSFFDVYDISAQEFFAHVGCSIDHLLRATSLRHFDRVNLQRLSGKTDVGFDRFDERFQMARSLFDTKRRWVDGTPENAENILLLRTLFPMARFVCTIRHPFDVVASMIHFERAGGKSMSMDDAANMWLQKVAAYILAARALGPTNLRIISYDQLSQHPAETLQDIFDFIGEPRFPNAAETFHARINSSRVNEDERQHIRDVVSTSPNAHALLRAYDAAMSLVNGNWEYDPQALIDLADRQNDIVTRLIDQVV